jgi:hypothetical protein
MAQIRLAFPGQWRWLQQIRIAAAIALARRPEGPLGLALLRLFCRDLERRAAGLVW